MPFKDVKVSNSNTFNDIFIFNPSSGHDYRGETFTTYHETIYDSYLPDDISFNHDRFTFSHKDVLRGLHYDFKTWKMVSCIKGSVYLVIVDCREGSETYSMWDAWVLNEKNKTQILIPPGFANGFFSIVDSVFHYKMAYNGEYSGIKDQKIIMWDDPLLRIKWPKETGLIMSTRDLTGRIK